MVKNKIKIIFLLFTLLSVSNCGYKSISLNEENKFQINRINVSGNAKDAYALKNEILLYSSKNTKNLIELDIIINNASETKEKDIKNLVTKYENIYNVSLKMKVINSGKTVKKKLQSKRLILKINKPFRYTPK